MTNLTGDTVLQRAPCLRLNIDSGNNIEIYLEGSVIRCGSNGLVILDAFYQPISLSEALRKLKMRFGGVQDWMDSMTTIVHLYEAGVLRDGSKNIPTLAAFSGYDSAPIHVAMLNDRVRTSTFIRGIHEVVRLGDIVADIGTGTGILAVVAARAGARHVYAIEASGIGKSAKAIFEANGLSDRITLFEGWSTQINLPEPADVLISEMIGNEPLAENVLEITTDAVKRLLKPNGRLVPNKVKILGLPVSIPPNELMKYTFITPTLKNWQSWYGVDFSPLKEIVRNSCQTFFVNSSLAKDWKTLSEPIPFAEVDFKDITELVIDNTATITANALGQLDGILEYFELDLGPTARLSTHPSQVDLSNHWRSPVWVVIDPLHLKSGDQFTVTYQYRKTEKKIDVSVKLL